MLEIFDRCPDMQQIIYDDFRGLGDYDKSNLTDFADVQKQGREYAKENPDYLLQEINKGTGEDVGIFLYTSGTTGKPKGVVMTNDNIIITCRNSIEFDKLTADEDIVSYLPMAWVGDHIFSYGQAYLTGFCVNCPESEETVSSDLRELLFRPTSCLRKHSDQCDNSHAGCQ